MATRNKKHEQKAKVSELSIEDFELLISKAVQDATKSLQEAISGLMDEVNELKEEIISKDHRIDELKSDCSGLEIRLDDLQQYGRRNNLRIFGVKESSTASTDARVLAVVKTMGVDLPVSAIDRFHRLGKPGNNDQTRPIIVKFVSYADRNRVFMAKRQLNGTEVTVREDLTKMRLDILKEAVKAYSMKKVWTSDGVIKVNVGLKYPMSVRHMQEFHALIRKHPPADSN